ncbi:MULTISPECIES: hypothetical protein [Cysteiniphilum]|uniref:hypothetical protein n=1 Tax=Cysteiniphilum TaxID=2056696 RepID=UPI00178746AF|nr:MULTISPECIES: hypothetical protein [Cysteiniphilum]
MKKYLILSMMFLSCTMSYADITSKVIGINFQGATVGAANYKFALTFFYQENGKTNMEWYCGKIARSVDPKTPTLAFTDTTPHHFDSSFGGKSLSSIIVALSSPSKGENKITLVNTKYQPSVPFIVKQSMPSSAVIKATLVSTSYSDLGKCFS